MSHFTHTWITKLGPAASCGLRHKTHAEAQSH